MRKVIKVSSDDDVMDVARKWYLKLEGEAGNDRTLQQFEEWLALDSVHRDAFDSVVDFWSHIDSMPEIQEMREAGTFFTGDVSNDGVETKAGFSQRWRSWAVAATILIVCSFALDMYQNYLPEGTYRTATGERQTIQLADGSTVHLNTHSMFSVDFTDKVRRIHLLEGEACFNVAKDDSRPFIIETSRGEVRAVGTSFNVYDSEDMVEVLVFEGTVVVDPKNNKKTIEKNGLKAVLVSGGDRVALFDDNLGVVRAANGLEVAQKNAWREGKIVFRGQKLSDVIREVSRYTNKKIVIVDDSLKGMKLGGAFDVDDLDALFHAIEDAFPVRVVRFTPYIAVIIEA